MRIRDAGDSLSDDLRAFWPMDDGAGATWTDISGYRNHGRGGGASPPRNPSWGHSPLGKATVFDGTDDYIVVPAKSPINVTQAVSLSVWIYPTGWGESNFGRLIDKDNGGTGWAIYLDNSLGSSGVGWRFGGSTGGLYSILSLNKWQHVVVATRDASTFYVWVNGILRGSAGGGAGIGTTTTDLGIGNRVSDTARTFAGRMVNMRMWGRALNNADAARLYVNPWAGTVRERRRVWYLPSAGLAGSLSATLADATLSAAGGATGIEGVLAVTLADATGSAAGALAIAGAASVALADASVSSAGALAIAGALSTALADATLSSAGALAIAGSLSATLADAALSAVGTGSSNAGALAVTLADATLVAAGALAIAGAASVALADASVSSAGTLAIVGSLSAALADATLSSAGALAITGSLSATLADATLAAVGTGSSNTGALAVTLADATLTSAGALAISGGAGLALADAVLVSAGTVALRGSLSAVLADAGISAAGALVVSGSLAVTLANASLSAVGNFAAVVVMSPPARRTYRLDVAARRAQLAQDLRAYMVAAESRITRLPRDDET